MKGVYILVIRVSKNLQLNIGSLGKIFFLKGFYVYVGSAQSQLEKRIKRHLSKRKRIFWHIDYFLNSRYAKIIKVLCKNAKKEEECRVAREIKKIGVPIPRFGSSDCGCISHLFQIKRPTFTSLQLKEYLINNK